MTDTSLLNTMINQSAMVGLQNYNVGAKKVVLIEHQTANSELEIRNIPEDSVVIEVDKSISNNDLFSNKKQECKRADYLIVSEQNNLILFIEMKKGKHNGPETIKQLKGSLCVLNYIQSIAREFYKEHDFLDGYNKLFIVFQKVNTKKKKTSYHNMRENIKSNTPENPKIFSQFTDIQFNRILGKP